MADRILFPGHERLPGNGPLHGAALGRVVLILLVTLGLLTGDFPRDLKPSNVASARSQPLTIIVYDYTGRWGSTIEAGVRRWNAGLSQRGFSLSYSRRIATPCESLSQPAYGIAVCDTSIPHPSGWQAATAYQGVIATREGPQLRGLIQFYRAAPSSSYADMMVCHELGHALQLGHVAAGSDSCMTPVPQLVSPSASDIANALWSVPDTAQDQSKVDRKKKKGGKGKKGGKSKKHRHK